MSVQITRGMYVCMYVCMYDRHSMSEFAMMYSNLYVILIGIRVYAYQLI